jgi:hypothetical protein
MTTDSDMPDLSLEAQALLREGRSAFEPDAAQLELVRSQLFIRLGTNTPTSLDGSSQTTPASSGAATALGIKAGLATVAIIAALGGVGFSLWQSRTPEPRIISKPSSDASASPEPPQAEPPAPPQPSAAPAEIADSSGRGANARLELPRRPRKLLKAASPTPAREPALYRTSESATSGEVEPKAAAVTTAAQTRAEVSRPDAAKSPFHLQPSATSDPRPALPRAAAQNPFELPRPVDVNTLSRETALIQKARAALKRNDVALALRFVREHATRFPLGVLREERLATQIIALCAQGKTAPARAAFSELHKIAPESAYLQQLERSCVGSE